jgi:adenylate kinase family enzyme
VKPLVIIVSGAPGSGKSTLARAIAARMMIPHIERDMVLRGIELTKGDKINRGKLGIERYYQLLQQMIEGEISFVTDGTIYKNLSEADIEAKLKPIAHVVNVHARATDEMMRFKERESKREDWSDVWVEDHMKRLHEIYPLTVDPLDLGVTVIEVDATSDYNPSITAVVDSVRQDYEHYTRAINRGEK